MPGLGPLPRLRAGEETKMLGSSGSPASSAQCPGLLSDLVSTALPSAHETHAFCAMPLSSWHSWACGHILVCLMGTNYHEGAEWRPGEMPLWREANLVQAPALPLTDSGTSGKSFSLRAAA